MLRLPLRRLGAPSMAALGLALLAACTADPLQLDGRACGPGDECVDGYVCDTARNVCVRPGQDSGTDASGGSGATAGSAGSGTGGSGGSGATAGSGGSGATAGTGGSAGSGGSGGKPGCTGTTADCDGNAANGCEVDTSSDPLNCGACGRACSGAHVASVECTAGRCTSTCDLGYANCSTPAAPNSDDGCETNATSSSDCGGCGNSCLSQGSAGGLVCSAGSQCSCNNDSKRCHIGPAKGTCDAATGLCKCGGNTCRPGEVCTKSGASDVCTCNGKAGCGPSQTCCQTPGQCIDLDTSAANCGACGHACPAGFTCSSGTCGCTGNAQCNAGSAGSCDTASGHCVCNGKTCGVGERCQPSGACG